MDSQPLRLQPGWWSDLIHRHEQPTRHYHTIHHVRELLDHWNVARSEGAWVHPKQTFIAALLHDVEYDVTRRDNEQRSADLVPAWTQEWVVDAIEVEPIQALILHTAHHGHHEQPLSPDEALFVDCDMAILAAPEPRFLAYEEQIRAEWEPVVGAEAYATGRRRFFEGLIGRTIYQSDYGKRRWQDKAQANLSRWVSASRR